MVAQFCAHTQKSVKATMSPVSVLTMLEYAVSLALPTEGAEWYSNAHYRVLKDRDNA